MFVYPIHDRDRGLIRFYHYINWLLAKCIISVMCTFTSSSLRFLISSSCNNKLYGMNCPNKHRMMQSVIPLIRGIQSICSPGEVVLAGKSRGTQPMYNLTLSPPPLPKKKGFSAGISCWLYSKMWWITLLVKNYRYVSYPCLPLHWKCRLCCLATPNYPIDGTVACGKYGLHVCCQGTRWEEGS